MQLFAAIAKLASVSSNCSVCIEQAREGRRSKEKEGSTSGERKRFRCGEEGVRPKLHPPEKQPAFPNSQQSQTFGWEEARQEEECWTDVCSEVRSTERLLRFLETLFFLFFFFTLLVSPTHCLTFCCRTWLFHIFCFRKIKIKEEN